MRKLAWIVAVLGLTSCGPVRDDECIDEDMDGVCVFDDVDDLNAKCGTDPTDADGDKACLGIDCDDSTATGAACTDGCLTLYADRDGDGFGDQAAATMKCEASAGFVADTGQFDCDDTPGSGRTRVPIDFDGDGANTCDDCDDTDPSLHPAAAELCDGIDNDCNPATDETQGDLDGDGFLGCADFCPMQPDGAAPAEIVWEWFETNTGSAADPCACGPTGTPTATGTYTFTINGTQVGTANAVAAHCICNPPIQTLTTPATDWNPSLPTNALAFTTTTNANTNHLLGWLRARLKYAGGGERVICVYDHGGGDCTAPDLCNGTFCDASAAPACNAYVVCPAGELNEPVAAQVDADNDGFGATCDCADGAPNRNPSLTELCNNTIDDDCDGLADMMDDECVACNRTVRTEANRCGNMLDDDCDGKMDGEDDDCVGSIC